MRRLPPLTALRVFEAVGRCGSVRTAANELSVTPAAISHQIRLLEEHLGVELFARTSRGLQLTLAGGQYFRSVNDVFDQLIESGRELAEASGLALRVHSLPSFASCWLVPRIGKFYAAHPGIEVEVTTVGDPGQPADLTALEADLAIRVGLHADQWPGLTVEKLVHEEMFPVCAPDLEEVCGPLKVPADLAHHTLLHVSRRAEGWPEWLAEARGAAQLDCSVDISHGPKFDTIQLALTAAVEGVGVTIGRLPLVRDFLDSGALIQPFALSVTSRNAYFLLSAANRPLSPAAKAFRTWLRAELGLAEPVD
jgi:LysR family glycine cleavage system transcriptional activator